MFRPESSREVFRVVAMHAGGVRDSASSELAARCLEAVKSVAPFGFEGHVLAMADHVDTICRTLGSNGPECHPSRDSYFAEARDEIAAADGIVAITPIVHGSYSGLFKAFVDLVGTKALSGKPVLIGACGGTHRHCLALEHVVRPLFVCLRCVVVPTSVFAIGSECGPSGIPTDIKARIGRAAGELAGLIAGSQGVQPVMEVMRRA